MPSESGKILGCHGTLLRPLNNSCILKVLFPITGVSGDRSILLLPAILSLPANLDFDAIKSHKSILD